MGFLDIFRSKGADALNRLSGNTDFLEATCAAAVLVAAADGDVSDEEIVAAIEGMQNNKALASAYNAAQIETEMMKQGKRAKTPSGRIQLKREITDIVAKDPSLREDVFMVAADVAYADGNVSDAERRALNGIAQVLSLDANKLLAA